MPLPPYFTFSVSDANETDLVLVSLHDSRTGFTVRTALPNSGKQTASIMAFAGARYSRSDLSAEGLFKEIKEAKKSANEKLATIFKNYGHASVADMALLFCYIENVPDLYAPIFYSESSVGAGQHRSTRYQDFSNSAVIDLSEYLNIDLVQNKEELVKTEEFSQVNSQFRDLQDELLSKYRKWVATLTNKFTQVYGVDTENKKEVGALTARVFDSARYFLPSGTALKTSFAYITSAREWARIIAIFKANPDQYLQYLGEQLEYLFAPEAEVADQIGYVPEAPDLIRYTGADETTGQNLSELENYLQTLAIDGGPQIDNSGEFKPVEAKLLDSKITAGQKVLAQNILSLYPNLKEEWLLDWLANLPAEIQQKLSKITFQNFNHHQQTGNQFKVNTHSFILTCSISETRDLIRHRAWGRFIPLLSTENYLQTINCGYTLPLYLSENPKLASEREVFEQDLQEYYIHLKSFVETCKKVNWFPQNLILQLLPFAHIMKMWFHGSPKEISYMANLRVRPGGHINYRMLAYQIAELTAQSDPFLSAMELGQKQKPDPSNRLEFVDRS